jgi:hypothetical protein
MPLNIPLLTKIVAQQGQKVFVRQIRPIAKLDFESKKQQFLREFDADAVSQEIGAGPEAYSQVQALASAGGNLFSLLGFYAEQKPIDALRGYLSDNIVLYKTGAGKVAGKTVTFETQVLAPSEEDVNSFAANNGETQVGDNWSGRSFTEMLANGVGGLPNYLFDLTRDFSKIPSRSGPAIQAKNPIRNTNVPRIPYVRRLLGVLEAIISPRK